ncbi:MAG: imidazoleglycerol-phosphate dehydratase HisB [Desulfocapsaceae bacterium]|nr:imidazoleglycerol-phosphate dehydratase HisB [Desulfocapsaceae bacterium]
MSEQQTRIGSVQRTTLETDISVALTLDGTGQTMIDSDVPFLDHMLTLFGVHGFFDLIVNGKGDVQVDDHHTVEDVGICLGKAFREALGDFTGIARYGECCLPMDETLVRVVVDISNRPFLHYNVAVSDSRIGSFDTALAKEFLRAFAQHAGVTLHVDLLHGENSHHIIEAVFKGLGRAMRQAVGEMHGIRGALSSKGCL